MVQSTSKFGQLSSWDDASSATNGGGKDFLPMKEDGDYVLRFLTEIPFEYMIHWVELEGKKITKVKCASRGCILCAKNNPAKTTFVANVFDRKTERCYIYEFGRQVFDQLKRYVSNPRWGDVRKYDVRINKEKGRKPNVYIVQAEPPISPLSDAEITMAREFIRDRGDLNKLAAPYTNEDIQKRLPDLFGPATMDVAPTTTGRQNFGSKSNVVQAVEDVSTDFPFPDFESPDFN